MYLRSLPTPIKPHQAITALAPMQDVTDLAFMTMISDYGSPDYFFTEYFRVYADSRPERHILRAITENSTNRPIFAQLIGESIPDLVRVAKELAQYAIAGIDLNMGCPAPRIYRKNVGGGLLRDPVKVDQILGALRESVNLPFTVKMRIGFENTENFHHILNLINRHDINLLSLHGRTVKEMYRSEVHYDRIAEAVRIVKCPVLANGNITSALSAGKVLAETRAAGVMIGRSAIRNPWIFSQIRQYLNKEPVQVITLGAVRSYIDRLYANINPNIPERSRVSALKKYLNFIGQSVDAAGNFLFDMRRATQESELFDICDRYLLNDPDQIFAPEPYGGLIARPSCEGEIA
ncbi:tRNA-dihydrouridine synthase [Synechococcus sp. PCC 7502]|uniref:tRNA-dihydrouridine synthase family protein n=1 Tax=Synechococcus sp. PCC 7502 TaxID=1173263 RepID=UPI00029FB84C|nr:tRNA-dihydrouridine synthase family protein [Synechococcus sp. PCC 7502]AFY72434.1 tRNA-dihydrouridine synthase [Synechococcus sp. PCC 7502]